MKVKNYGTSVYTINVNNVKYQFDPDQVVTFEDKLEFLVDEAILPYDDLKVILENDLEGAGTTAEIGAAIAAHEALGDPHAQYQKESEKDLPGGYPGLDGGGKVSAQVLPNSVMQFNDFWDASTNTPALSDGSGNAGDVFEVSIAGSQDLGSGSQSFDVGDWVVYTGSGIWKKSLNSAAAIPDASLVVSGKVNTIAQSFAGLKTFNDGLNSNEEILIDSTLNPYASIRSKSLAGNTKDVVLASGDSATGVSGRAILAAGNVTKTLGAAVVFQGLTIQMTSAGGLYDGLTDNSVEIIVDDANITNPATPLFTRVGSAGQRLKIRVNSATTVDQLITQYNTQSAFIKEFVITGTGLTTFTNGDIALNSGVDFGETVLDSGYAARIESTRLILGEAGVGNTQHAITTAKTTGTTASNTLFILTGQVDGTANSGGISIRSADMLGSGASGGTFIRTGSVNGSLASGNLNLATGATNPYSTANTGGINMISGNVGGVSGNSGNVFVGSGTINAGATSGTTGQAQFFAGGYAGSGSVNGGIIFIGGSNFTGAGSGNTGNLTVRVADKTNSAATGNTGTATFRSGNHSGTGGTTGSLSVTSGDMFGANIGGTTGSSTFRSGNITNSAATGSTGFVALVSGDNSGSGNTGYLEVRSGQILGSGTGSTGFVNFYSGTVNNGSGSSGQAFLGSGNTVNGPSGNVLVQSGTITGTAAVTSGAVTLASGGMTNGAATANTGQVQVFSGNVSAGPGNSGSLNMYSGTVQSGTSGQLSVNSGYAFGNGNSGSAGFSSGNVSGTGTSGYTYYGSGAALGGGSSGQSDIRTGNASINSGQIVIQTGDAASGNSGGISIITGAAGTNRGSVNIQGYFAEMESAGGNIHLKHNAGGVYVVGSSNSFGLVLQTDTQNTYGHTFHARVGMNNFQNKTHLAIEAGNDSATAVAGDLILTAGFAGNAPNNGGSIYLESGGAIGGQVGGDIVLRMNGITKGKLKIKDASNNDGTSGTVGHVWTQTAADGSGQWQAVPTSNLSGVETAGSLFFRPTASGQDFAVVTRDGGGFTGVMRIRSGVQTANGTSGNAILQSGDSNAHSGSTYVTTGNADYLNLGNNGSSGSVYINSGTATGTGVSGNINIATGTGGSLRGKVFVNAAALNIATTAAPSNPVNGDMYFDGSDLIMYIGGAWYKFTKTLV